MSVVTTAAVHDEPMRIRFEHRQPMRAGLRQAIRAAFIASPHARMTMHHDFGLERPVVFAHPDDYRGVAWRALATHVVVCEDPGGECLLYLVPTDDGSLLQCLVLSGDMLRECVGDYLTWHYMALAFDAATGEWRTDLSVPGAFHTLIADADGEFAGVTVDLLALATDPDHIDTSAAYRLDVLGDSTPTQPVLLDADIEAFVRERRPVGVAA